jgi:plastocyanin
MGISEHYEFLFQLPKLKNDLEQTDYLYESSSEVAGLTGGNWGILRAYNRPQHGLAPVPGRETSGEGAGCTTPTVKFDVTAAFARNILSGPLIYNARGDALNPGMNQIVDWNALMYVRTEDLDPVTHKLKSGAPREPLFLRAAAGDCIQVTLRNRLLPEGEHMNRGRTVPMIGRTPTLQDVKINTSHQVGLHAQLVSYDMSKADGVNVGLNPSVTVAPGKDTVFNWYAGTVHFDAYGKEIRTPVEFGAVNLSPADPMMQHPYGLVGGLIIEPQGSKWKEDVNSHASAVVTKADGTRFREFAAVIHDDLAALRLAASIQLQATVGPSGPQWAVNGTNQANNFQLTLGEGDIIAVQVKSGFHGFSFMDKAQALSAFKIIGGMQFVAQPAVGPTAFGTTGVTANNNSNGLVELAILQVKPFSEIPASVTSVKFECTIHKTNMAGSFVLQRPTQPTNSITMDGAIVNGAVAWVRNGTALPNHSTVQISPGMTVTFAVQSGTHGITFLGANPAAAKALAEQVFDFGTPGQPFQDQTASGNIGWGTNGVSTAGTVLATLKVKDPLPPGITSIPFQCTIHKTNMAGTFEIVPKPGQSSTFPPPYTYDVPNGWTRAVNYRTEPLSYRFPDDDWLQNITAKVPGGISRALTDELVQADPQTPVFAAGRGIPVRMRMFHPAGSNEQVISLHGHFWQEEPYSDNSARIGHNPLSQAFGARDTFGANASFDMVLNHAGGVFGVPGDYLFRTFIGNDFLFGMWGLMRVGEEHKDIVRVTRFEEVEPAGGGKRIIVTGINTVNTDTGEMAPQVDVFSGTGPGKTKLGTVQLNQQNGMWSAEFSVAALPSQITIISPLGGEVVSGSVTSTVTGKANRDRLFSPRAVESDPCVNAFRNLPQQDDAQPVRSPCDVPGQSPNPATEEKSHE